MNRCGTVDLKQGYNDIMMLEPLVNEPLYQQSIKPSGVSSVIEQMNDFGW
jgi:hypothetical protein